jgi:hypothetical protein
MKNIRLNQIEEKQLLKKLEQLNIEESRNRLKYERFSTDLIYFLKENRETTGYLSKTCPSRLKRKTQEILNDDEIDAVVIDDYDTLSEINDDVFINDKTTRPQTAHFHNKNNKIYINRRQSAPSLRSINHVSESPLIKNLNSNGSSTPVSPKEIIPSNCTTPIIQKKRNEDITKISTNNRYLINNNKFFKRKFSFDFINNTKITVNMSKDYIRKEKARIIYENKVNQNAELMAGLQRIQSAINIRVKQFRHNIT